MKEYGGALIQPYLAILTGGRVRPSGTQGSSGLWTPRQDQCYYAGSIGGLQPQSQASPTSQHQAETRQCCPAGLRVPGLALLGLPKKQGQKPSRTRSCSSANRAGRGPARTLMLGEQRAFLSDHLATCPGDSGTPLPTSQVACRLACLSASLPLDRGQDTVSHPESFTPGPLLFLHPPPRNAYFHL